MTLTISQLNDLDREAFVTAVGWVFEDSPWVAAQAWSARPFGNLDALHGAMVTTVANADRSKQLALLRAHPDLGTRARMTDASRGEQAGVGLDRLTPEAFATLQQLNTAYQDKFGFPFLFAVKGSTSQQIIDALQRRLPRSANEEFEEALQQVYRIARFRLDEFIP